MRVSIVIFAMTVIPLVEILSRKILHRTLIPGAAGYEEHLTLWVTFLGAALATKYGRHLALSTLTFLTTLWFRIRVRRNGRRVGRIDVHSSCPC